MRITLADKFIAYLTLFSGLTISAVAVWYSVAGLVSIFAAAVTPIIVMGVALEVSKLIATVWLKLNWHRAPTFIKGYLLSAIAILMIITSMGIFGFLSKAHSDQSLVSGDVQSKIAVYDEKIKIAKENIDANRKALKQLDEAVDQVMGRSTTETGADKAVAIRRGQAKERTRLLQDIATEQKTIAQLNEERAPIAAEVRKVEAEVGPIKYIAAFIYGDNPDANVLEKAVTWVIIIIVSVFDPLAVILLLASQYSFQWFRKSKEEEEEALLHETVPLYVADVGEKPTEEEKAAIAEPEPDLAEEANALIDELEKEVPEVILPEESKEVDYSTHTYLHQPFVHFKDLKPMVYTPEEVKPLTTEEIDAQLDKDLTESKFKILPELQDHIDKDTTEFPAEPFTGQQFKHVSESGEEKNYIFNGRDWIFTPVNNSPLDQWNKMIEEAEKAVEAELVRGEELLQDEESKKKSTYMIKEQGNQVTKTKE